jgi:hypothetical protein
VWQGSVSTAWKDDANWNWRHAPTEDETAVFTGADAPDCILADTRTVAQLYMVGFSHDLEINQGFTLTVSSVFQQDSGTITGAGNLVINASKSSSWTGGAMTGDGKTDINGTALQLGSVAAASSLSIAGSRQVEIGINSIVKVLSATISLKDDARIDNNGIVVVLPTLVPSLSAKGPAYVKISGGPKNPFTNAGFVMFASAPTGGAPATMDMSAPFVNAGFVYVGGLCTLRLNAGVTIFTSRFPLYDMATVVFRAGDGGRIAFFSSGVPTEIDDVAKTSYLIADPQSGILIAAPFRVGASSTLYVVNVAMIKGQINNSGSVLVSGADVYPGTSVPDELPKVSPSDYLAKNFPTAAQPFDSKKNGAFFNKSAFVSGQIDNSQSKAAPAFYISQDATVALGASVLDRLFLNVYFGLPSTNFLPVGTTPFLRINGGKIENDGKIAIRSIQISLFGIAELANRGVMTIESGDITTLNDSGQITNTGTIYPTFGSQLWITVPYLPSVVNRTGGVIDLTRGPVRFESYSNAGGRVKVGKNLLPPPEKFNQSLFGSLLEDTNGGGIAGMVTVQGGDVEPGGNLSAGTFSIQGTYSQGPSAQLDIEVGGYAAGTGFDQVNISSQAILGGTLNIGLINGFSPNVGDSFQIMTYGSYGGTFQSVTGDVFGSGTKRFLLQYNATNLTLVVA